MSTPNKPVFEQMVMVVGRREQMGDYRLSLIAVESHLTWSETIDVTQHLFDSCPIGTRLVIKLEQA